MLRAATDAEVSRIVVEMPTISDQRLADLAGTSRRTVARWRAEQAAQPSRPQKATAGQ